MVWRLIPSKFLNGAGAPENSEQPGLHPLVETAELGTGKKREEKVRRKGDSSKWDIS
jgi:hypothetical protein